MKNQTIIIQAEAGLHARPAGLIVKKAGSFQSKITLQKGDKTADAKRLLTILTLGAKKGEELIITADGVDEEAAVAAIIEIIENDH